MIIVDNNRGRINTLSSTNEITELAITSYLAYFAREGEIEKICFLLTQYTAESCSIPKNLRNVAKLLVDIQKKWLEFCL